MRSQTMSHRLAPLALMASVTLGGCAKTGPITAPAPALLEVPPPPPRVISLPPEPVAPVATTTTTPPSVPKASRPTRPPVRQDTGANRAGQAAPATDAEPAPVAEVPAERPAETPAQAGPLLRTPQTADESQADRRIRTVLTTAGALLSGVNVATLTREARAQHDTARRFIEQAQQALIERNYVFASYLADKAETLARGLSR